MEQDQAAPGDATMEHIQPAGIFRLPPELRDQIYRLAFVENENTSSKIIALEKWMQQERENRRIYGGRDSRYGPTGRSHQIRSIPTCPHMKMLVNKQFFNESATSFLRYQTIECDDMHTLNRLFKDSKQLRKNVTRLVCQWDMSAELRRRPFIRFFSGISGCKSLRDLHITVHDHVFDTFKNQLACVHDFNEKDFQQVCEVNELVRMPSLKTVRLTAHRSKLASTEAEQRQWCKNVASFEDYINKQLKKVQEEKQTKASDSKANPVGLKAKPKLTPPSSAEAFDGFDEANAELEEALLRDERSGGFWDHLKSAFSRRHRPPTVQYRGSKPTGITKCATKIKVRGSSKVVPPSVTTNSGSAGLSRKHIAMTAGIAFAVSSVNSIVLMKLLAR